MRESLTLGSLFDGSGGWSLAAAHSGIRLVWASEIDPFCIRVTTKRFPDMKHLGDIRRINGAEIEPVDIISFSSPCQNLSVAGRQEGVTSKESGLFFEAIRIIREMREATHGRHPRFLVWENVPGAFSSNCGEDFRTILTEIIGLAAPGAQVPAPDKNGWPAADLFLGDGWSVAYRTLDAQYFGVPQRRNRIFLVMDFGSERAGDALFERAGVSRNFAAGGGSGENAAGRPAPGVGDAIGFLTDSGTLKRGVNAVGGVSPTLRAGIGSDDRAAVAIQFNPTDSRIKIGDGEIVQTLTQRMGTGGNQVPLMMCIAGNTILRAPKNGGNGVGAQEDLAYTLNCTDRHAVAYGMDRATVQGGRNMLYKPVVIEEQMPTMTSQGPGAVGAPGAEYVVRRLSVLECCRLQGFPDDWCDDLETPNPTDQEIDMWGRIFETHRRAVEPGKKPKTRNQIIRWLRKPYSASAAYRMWGNGICVQCAIFVLRGIAEMIEDERRAVQTTRP